jgi:hypothetical protein
MSMGLRFRCLNIFLVVRDMIHALACLSKKGVLKPLFFVFGEQGHALEVKQATWASPSQ